MRDKAIAGVGETVIFARQYNTKQYKECKSGANNKKQFAMAVDKLLDVFLTKVVLTLAGVLERPRPVFKMLNNVWWSGRRKITGKVNSSNAKETFERVHMEDGVASARRYFCQLIGKNWELDTSGLNDGASTLTTHDEVRCGNESDFPGFPPFNRWGGRLARWRRRHGCMPK